ncbi:VOC family protein [Silvibacterium acidisoli]|uniref:VOC family protein n=1 Tax=Acidobacteriaceae bacterium ZG23-2 TaxID=2883246 RepID=UPI00406CD76E
MSATAEQVKGTAVANGDFIWYELRTTDTKSALDFYTHVVGWKAMPSGNPGGVEYTLLAVDNMPIVGVMPILPDMAQAGMKPAWAGFIGVDDVDAYAKKAEAAGGKVVHPPTDIPSVGRFAALIDPQGAHFLIFKGSREMAPPMPAPGSTGTIGWHELSARDEKSAWEFYSGVFGWKEESQMDMGPNGIYRIFQNGDKPRMGGMMKMMNDSSPVPFWLYYFAVDEIGAAEARIREKGGNVVMGPHEVPGKVYIIIGTDPQGAVFAVVGPKK